MIKIIPWADRKLSMKNWRKIWNLFPYGEICMTEIDREWEHQNWAEKIARYYITRGRNFSVEIQDVQSCINFVFNLLFIGVRKFYFVWRGLRQDYFFSAFDVITIAKSMIETCPDAQIVIIYAIEYADKSRVPDMDMVKTSIYAIRDMTKDVPQIKLMFRYPHPWSGDKRQERLKWIREWIEKSNQSKKMDIEPRCGCITITPNTNIYPCEFCHRKKRKKKFGDSARDKYVCGTLEKGLFRIVECNVCQGGRSRGRYKQVYLRHKPIGGG